MQRVIGGIVGAVFVLAVLLGAPLAAQQIFTLKDPNLTSTNKGDTGGTRIDALALTSGRYTGWIYAGTVDDIVFDITVVNATGPGLGNINMACQTSRIDSTANGAGYDLHMLTSTGTSSSPVVTSGIVNWRYTPLLAATYRWSWSVYDVPAPYINCYFTATGTPGANDKITVFVRGITP